MRAVVSERYGPPEVCVRPAGACTRGPERSGSAAGAGAGAFRYVETEQKTGNVVLTL